MNLSDELQEESATRLLSRIRALNLDPLFLTITGSHVWGLDTPKSDLDIRGVFGWPLERTLALSTGRDNYEGVIDEYIDYQVYEIKKALKMLLKANGNVVEFLLNPYTLYTSYWGNKLKTLAHACLTKRLSNYYLGYATGQRKRAAKNRGGRALLYTYRELFAGIWLMQTRNIIHNFLELKTLIAQKYNFDSHVLNWSLEHRDTPVSDGMMAIFEQEWEDLSKLFNRVLENSLLPEKEPEWVTARAEKILWTYRVKDV